MLNDFVFNAVCVMNCGTAFHDRIATERFMKALIHLGGKYLKKKEYFKIEDANSAKASDQISVFFDLIFPLSPYPTSSSPSIIL